MENVKGKTMQKLLKELFNKYNIPHTDEMLQKLDLFYNMVVEENKKFNLTAITEKHDFAVKHILDSCLPYDMIPKNAKVIDVGAGAGFPSVPLKIIRPDLNLTMLDSLNKRVNFLNLCIDKLNLKNAEAIHFRAEDYALKNRETFDISIARAVASLETLSEYCLPFVKVNGSFIALKGSSYKEELEKANYAINILGGKVEKIQNITLQEIDGERANINIKKIKATPNKYPRGKNLPRLKPLADVK